MALLIEGLHERKLAQSTLVIPEKSEVIGRVSGAEIKPIKISSPLSLKAARSIAQLTRLKNIEIIHAHTSHGHNLGLLAKLFGAKGKVIVHRRVDYRPSTDPLNLLKYRTKLINQYVAISTPIVEILTGLEIEPDRINLVPSAINDKRYANFSRDEERRKLLERFRLPENTVLIGNASALSDQKDYPTLFRALTRLVSMPSQYPLHCFIAGKGEKEDKLKQAMESMQLQKYVTFLGFLKKPEELLSALDILAVTSKYEGLGTIVLEGIAAGCAICSTSAGGITDMISHGSTGLLAEPGDDAAFSENLRQLVHQTELRQTLAEQARTHTLPRFSLDSMVDGNYAVYRKALIS